MTYALLYHDIISPSEDNRPDTGPLDRYTLDGREFRAHLDAIARTRVEIGLVGAGRLPPAALSFDDGARSAPAVADELEARGWRGHFLVTTSLVGRPGFVTREETRELAARGHVVGSHSHTHPSYMARLSRRELDDEWRRSREILAGMLGAAPEVASVPGGQHSRAVLESAAAAGYRVLMTSEPTARIHRVDGMLVIGRFAIRAHSSAQEAARLIAGNRLACRRQAVAWRLKQAVKRASPRFYEAARRGGPTR